MAVSWQQAQDIFPAAKAQAIADRTCFCVCGCRATDTAPGSILGMTVPGLCPKCHRRKGHERVVSAAMLTVAPETIADREAAEAYLRSVGTATSKTIAALSEKVEAGKPLTDAQVDTVVRAKEADERSAEVAFRRLVAEHKRVAKDVDLTSLHIPATLAEGMYAVKGQKGDAVAVKVERPTTGQLSGWTVVTLTVGGTVVNYGLQKPPHRIFSWIKRTYRGWLPQVVAEVVHNPVEARNLYKQLEAIGG